MRQQSWSPTVGYRARRRSRTWRISAKCWKSSWWRRGLAGVEFIEEVGGGLNFKRKRFLALMDEIGRREVKTLILAHRDRLTRFGFEWFEHYAKTNGCEVLVLNQERLSPEQEMVQDPMTIVHCFRPGCTV
jgi:predicted site-specific integrase-resolvase